MSRTATASGRNSRTTANRRWACRVLQTIGTSARTWTIFRNPARALGGAPKEIQVRHIRNCTNADPAYGKGIAAALDIAWNEVSGERAATTEQWLGCAGRASLCRPSPAGARLPPGRLRAGAHQARFRARSGTSAILDCGSPRGQPTGKAAAKRSRRAASSARASSISRITGCKSTGAWLCTKCPVSAVSSVSNPRRYRSQISWP